VSGERPLSARLKLNLLPRASFDLELAARYAVFDKMSKLKPSSSHGRIRRLGRYRLWCRGQ